MREPRPEKLPEDPDYSGRKSKKREVLPATFTKIPYKMTYNNSAEPRPVRLPEDPDYSGRKNRKTKNKKAEVSPAAFTKISYQPFRLCGIAGGLFGKVKPKTQQVTSANRAADPRPKKLPADPDYGNF